MTANAYSRAMQMFAAIAAAMKLGIGTEREDELRRLGSYHSRGKGRGTPS